MDYTDSISRNTHWENMQNNRHNITQGKFSSVYLETHGWVCQEQRDINDKSHKVCITEKRRCDLDFISYIPGKIYKTIKIYLGVQGFSKYLTEAAIFTVVLWVCLRSAWATQDLKFTVREIQTLISDQSYNSLWRDRERTSNEECDLEYCLSKRIQQNVCFKM